MRNHFTLAACFMCLVSCHCNDPYWRYSGYDPVCVENGDVVYINIDDVYGDLDDPPFREPVRQGEPDESFGVAVSRIEETSPGSYTVDIFVARSGTTKTVTTVTTCNFDEPIQ